MKPKELADMLQISDRTLRAWLRVNFTRPLSEKGKEWQLNDRQTIASIEHFKKIKIKRSGNHFKIFGKLINLKIKRED